MNEILPSVAKFRNIPARANILIFCIVCLSVILSALSMPAQSAADSQSDFGLAPGGAPMPMFGSTFGGSNQPFKPIRSGIQRLRDLGYRQAGKESDCRVFAYNSNPPTSGLYLPNLISKNDIDGPISPCTIVNVLYKGNVVLFYDPKQVDADTLSEIKGLGTQISNQSAFTSQEQFGYAVILVRSQSIKTPMLFAAWRRLLPLKQWDTLLVNRFVSSYLGNPRKGLETEYPNRK